MEREIRAALDAAATIVLADGPDGADIVPTLLAASGRINRAVAGWMPGARAWTAELDDARALMGGYGLRSAIREGRADYVPIRLSAIPAYLATLPRPIVTVVRAIVTSRSTQVRWSSSEACGTPAVIVSRSLAKFGG